MWWVCLFYAQGIFIHLFLLLQETFGVLSKRQKKTLLIHYAEEVSLSKYDSRIMNWHNSYHKLK